MELIFLPVETIPVNCLGVLGSLRCDSIVDPNGTCYTASYAVQRDDSVTFIVSARTPANTWVGLGVSDDRLMVSAAMQCVVHLHILLTVAYI